ncbi:MULTISPECIES: helix-turn-helix domain-containing protein [unclassified Ruegeria]|uniref:helix-turn-helix domain-containing protein n=1 Tax=unclassified Ruegeria TaxID=2625375 RepID=UPI0020C383FB|nr:MULTISPECIES: helix-turn-helix domain-containing protein [unclassified Ruegeria]
MDVSIPFWYKSNMSGIQNYNLYGEIRDLPDVVHCEAIEQRSKLHNWALRPHRHARLHQVLLVDKGGGEAMLEGDSFGLDAGSLVNLPIGSVHGFTFKPQTTGWVVTLAAELLDQGLLDREGLRLELRTARVLRSDDEIRNVVRSIFAEHANRSFARAHILRAYSALLIGLVARRIAGQVPKPDQNDDGLLRQFERLLEKHALDHLGVADYASMIGVTPTHLSRVVRQATGHSASAAIAQNMVREARRNLAFTNLSISAIAFQLGYDDPSYFSRVFRRTTGMSPRSFRRSLGQDKA